MNIGKYYKAPYNIGVVGKVCCSCDAYASLLHCVYVWHLSPEVCR
jgi:hypothetical protein